ncbi:MAG: diheme cytochrome c-553 [Candidatus Zixiibacteriota bacterium]|nr:MAG: diheme cytochrome c-553 [candidate division Zixibacteria bacterium]
MKKPILWLVSLLLTAAVVLLGSQLTARSQLTPAQTSPAMPLLTGGALLVTYGGCHDCHSPKVMVQGIPLPDSSQMLSGYHGTRADLPQIPKDVFGPQKWAGMTNDHFTAWAGPWGVTFSRNITPDRQTGIGAWTYEMFQTVMRTGKYPTGDRQLLPPMPWYNVATLPEDQLRALYDYLMSIPPVQNAVPNPLTPQQAGITPGR